MMDRGTGLGRDDGAFGGCRPSTLCVDRLRYAVKCPWRRRTSAASQMRAAKFRPPRWVFRGTVRVALGGSVADHVGRGLISPSRSAAPGARALVAVRLLPALVAARAEPRRG